MCNFVSNSETETIKFAKDFASGLNNNSTVLLNGDLGAGKTKFVQGILEHFGLENEISSPTFTIVNEYSNDDITIYHFDLYRLKDINEFYQIGGEEYLQNGICIFEWGNIIKEILDNYIQIDIDKDINNENIKKINIH